MLSVQVNKYLYIYIYTLGDDTSGRHPADKGRKGNAGGSRDRNRSVSPDFTCEKLVQAAAQAENHQGNLQDVWQGDGNGRGRLVN